MRAALGLLAVILAALSAGCSKTTSVMTGQGATGPSSPSLLGSATTPKNGAPANPAPTSPGPLPGSGSAKAGTGANPKQTSTPQQLGFSYLGTKNTTRVAGADPISDAAAVALAVDPSTAPGTHPGAVALAPSDDWQASIAASSLMGTPFRAPLLLSTPGKLPTATASALNLLAPTGEAATDKAQVLQIGDTPQPKGYKTTGIGSSDPYFTAAQVDAYEARLRGNKESKNVVIASGEQAPWAMPAAGFAAESGEPVLFTKSNSVPAATAAQLAKHKPAHIYVLGPQKVISNNVTKALSAYGTVKRISAPSPEALSVALTLYRDPPCPANNNACAHIPGSFGWAIRTPGHGYTFINESQPLTAPASAALSASGSYGPQLLLTAPNTLPKPVLNFLINYSTPGYSNEGPTAAVYNHGWLIGDVGQISEAVQAQIDSLLEVVPTK
ncbi:MAG: cell wall-binding repeat-containing protein [Solirubrobacterales bacterium]|nr:cell wall-binding repeat-containing protein [Solirubrobacterales bacterium]